MGLSTERILSLATVLAVERHAHAPSRHLDIGAGHGDLIGLMRRQFPQVASAACDCTENLMQLRDQRVDCVDLNTQRLPYADASFDFVTCTEVIEHVENFREMLREVNRVLRAGGTLVVSTPNVLNLKSRFRYLVCGFSNLFGPLQADALRRHGCGGHINPVSVYYLVHALKATGFADIEVRIDKRQSSSGVLLPVLYPLIKVLAALMRQKEKYHYKTIDVHNEGDVMLMNRIDILLGRTILLRCRKAAPPQ